MTQTIISPIEALKEIKAMIDCQFNADGTTDGIKGHYMRTISNIAGKAIKSSFVPRGAINIDHLVKTDLYTSTADEEGIIDSLYHPHDGSINGITAMREGIRRGLRYRAVTTEPDPVCSSLGCTNWTNLVDGRCDFHRHAPIRIPNNVVNLWNVYQQNMRPETRNDFLRAFSLFMDARFKQ